MKKNIFNVLMGSFILTLGSATMVHAKCATPQAKSASVTSAQATHYFQCLAEISKVSDTAITLNQNGTEANFNGFTFKKGSVSGNEKKFMNEEVEKMDSAVADLVNETRTSIENDMLSFQANPATYSANSVSRLARSNSVAQECHKVGGSVGYAADQLASFNAKKSENVRTVIADLYDKNQNRLPATDGATSKP